MIGRKLRIEYHLLDKCNLNCSSCSHFCPLVKEETPKTLDKILQDFQKVYDITNKGDKNYIEKITIMGGEPLMYEHVSESMSLIRTLFKDTELELLTNGLLLQKMDDKFWQSIIRNNITICISIYPIKFDFNKLYEFLRIKNIRWYTYTIDMNNKRVFDSKWLKNEYDENSRKLAYDCRWRQNCTHLVDGKIYLCAMIAYFNHFDNAFKGQHNIKLVDSDSIDLDKITTWGELQLERDKVPHFCGHCKGLDLNFKEWSQSERKIDEWFE